MNLNISKSPSRGGKSPGKKQASFPLTPRSQGKQKTILLTKLYKAITKNIELKAKN
jgi:hypothetical protein